MKLKILLFFFTVLQASHGFSQTNEGKRFWIAYMENLTLSMNGRPQFTLVISGTKNCIGKIMLPAKNIEIAFTIQANVPKTIALPDAILYAEGSEVKSDKGILVTTTENVEVIAFHYRIYFSEASRILPEPALGSSYTLVCSKDADGSSPSSFVIVSCTNDNLIQITPSVFTNGFKSPGIPYDIRLNKGETYQVQASGDLSGTRVTSRVFGRIAVFGGGRQGNINASDCQSSPTADNHLYEQVLPDKLLGKHYLLVPLKDQGLMPVTVVATENDTRLVTPKISLMLSAGDVYRLSVTEPMEIFSSKPVNVMCFNKSQSCNSSHLGDPSQMMVMPAECQSKRQVVYASDAKNMNTMNYFKDHYVNIVCESRYTKFIRLDNQPVSFKFFPDNSMNSYAQVKIDPGFHTITSTDKKGGFSGTAYGFGDYDAYSYALGYQFPEPEIKPLLKVSLVNNPVTTGDMKILYDFPDSSSYNTRFEIYDAVGREVFAQGRQVSAADPVIHCAIEHLSAATYFLRVRINDDVVLVQPFIKL